MWQLIKRRIVDTTGHSISGLKSTWMAEEAFRIESLLFALLFPAAFWLGNSAVETSVLIISLFLVLIVELLNTGLEKMVDRISTEIHPGSKLIKDIGSGAVFLSIIQFLLVWGAAIYF